MGSININELSRVSWRQDLAESNSTRNPSGHNDQVGDLDGQEFARSLS